MQNIRKIETLPVLEKPKRVAAYARVSSGKDAMLQSLSAQVSYYSSYIQNHNGWAYAGVYADEALTGTKENRAEFNRMLEKCRTGSIDMIITKSISRFARNTVVLLSTVRELKELGVAVLFEEQGINTLSADGELMLTILASYAQEESLSASENQKWRVKRNFEEGKPCDGTIYGYRLSDGKYKIVAEEAKVIKDIYRLYLDGMGFERISKWLNERNIPSRFQGIWSKTTISGILTNYTYTGNLLLQKTFTENHITKKKCKNTGEMPKYHVEESHEAIISMGLFDSVQVEMKHRADKFCNYKKKHQHHSFTGKIKCGICGKSYRRKTVKQGIVWICTTFNSLGKKHCASKQIPDKILIEITASVAPLNEIQTIIASNGNQLAYTLLDGTTITRIWQDRSRKQSWTDEMKQAASERMKRNG